MLSLDPSEALSRLAAALVPALADWGSVQVRDEDERVYDVVVRHRDPTLRGVARRIEHLKTHRGLLTEPSRRAAGGENVLLPHVTAEQLPVQVPDPEMRALMQQLGMGSVLAVPIPGKVGLHSHILLANAPDGAAFTETDLALAVEIGRRSRWTTPGSTRASGGRRDAAAQPAHRAAEPPGVGDRGPLPARRRHRRSAATGTTPSAGRGDALVHRRCRRPRRRRRGGDGPAPGLLRGWLTTARGPPRRPRRRRRGSSDCSLARWRRRARPGLRLAAVAGGVTTPLVVTPATPPRSCSAPTARARCSHPARSGLLPASTGGGALHRRPSDLVPGDTAAVHRRADRAAWRISLDEGTAPTAATSWSNEGSDDLDRLCDALVDGLVRRPPDGDVAIVAVRPRPIATEDGDDRATPARIPTARAGRTPGRGHADQDLWARRPPPARTPGSSVLGRWSPRTPADVTAHRLQLAEAAFRGRPPLLRGRRTPRAGVRGVGPQRRATRPGTGRGDGERHRHRLAARGRRRRREHSTHPAIDRDAALGGLGLYLAARLSSGHGWTPAGTDRKLVWAHVEGSPAADDTEDTRSARRSH